ncbi:MAG TPA: hypothetical protein VKA67_08430, partial [Verrucomicrobiae bacterium]|nr:hypothetical protein [Verrucomicrobiae bacterium]
VRPVKPPPRYKRRPVKLLADCEYRLKMDIYKRKYVPRPDGHKPTTGNLMDTEYAKDYRQLIRFARTNHVRLVLANFSMAVNRRSNPDVREFYRSEIPWLHRQLEANVAHTRILQKLAGADPDIILVDTHPQLDGHYDKFIDLMHFTQQGREQLAENIFAGIRKILKSDLEQAAKPNLAQQN